MDLITNCSKDFNCDCACCDLLIFKNNFLEYLKQRNNNEENSDLLNQIKKKIFETNESLNGMYRSLQKKRYNSFFFLLTNYHSFNRY
jgi:hypothetical protein